jgi:thioredoxin-dependent peroxiredoxin
MERRNVVTMKGKPLTLVGKEMLAGDKAPDFHVLSTDLTEKSLSDFKGKIKLFASVPSIDTPVCDLQIKRFNEEAVSLSKDILVLFISADLPFAQKRFCQAYDIKKVKIFSDHRDMSFAQAYGVFIKELRLLARAVFIIDKQDIIRYVEYVPELTSQPDYAKALTSLSAVL